VPPFKVQFKPSVERDLRRLAADVVRRVLAAADRLADDPFPRGAVKLKGAERLHRIRIGQYRVVYEVDVHRREVTVHYVRDRETAYG
jgi:mRNA interferase RelE/StbE